MIYKAKNGDSTDFWCPACEKRQTKAHGMVVWINKHEVHVCTYLVCKRCFNSAAESAEPDRVKISDRCERALLAKYPELKLKLELTKTPNN